MHANSIELTRTISSGKDSLSTNSELYEPNGWSASSLIPSKCNEQLHCKCSKVMHDFLGLCTGFVPGTLVWCGLHARLRFLLSGTQTTQARYKPSEPCTYIGLLLYLWWTACAKNDETWPNREREERERNWRIGGGHRPRHSEKGGESLRKTSRRSSDQIVCMPEIMAANNANGNVVENANISARFNVARAREWATKEKESMNMQDRKQQQQRPI